MELQHFSHSYPLIFNEDQQGEGDGKGVICSGCEEPISGPRYRCHNTACHFFLHKKCAELPLEIKQHSLHPEHPLFLLPNPPTGYEGFCVCDLCDTTCSHFVYHCSSCKFDLDINCAFPPCFSEVKIRQGQHKFVRLLKSIPLKSSYLTCNFCGNDGDGSPLLCTLCLLIFHRECASLPETISIRQHPHLLTYTYFLEEDESGKPHCGVCQIQFNTGHGGYNCKECNFSSHVNCAKEFTAISSQIKTRNHESVDSSITCTAPATEVEHFSHEHKLILIEEDGNNAKCAGCMLPIFAPSYGCLPCNFVLHKACVELERKLALLNIRHTLFSRAETIDGVFFCDLCFQYCNGFVYRKDRGYGFLKEIEFGTLDVRCGVNLSSGAITHESHDHCLFYSMANNGRKCDGCGYCCWFDSFSCARFL